MITGLYSAGTAMEAAARQHEIISQNLAHLQMPGYRRMILRNSTFEAAFADHLQSTSGQQVAGTNAHDVLFDFSQGTLEQTEHPLDVALQGDGFFVVQGPQGPLYTRNGTFRLDEEGRLVTADNLPVNAATEIQIPPDTSFATIQIGSDGTVFANGAQVGQLEIVRFENPQLLSPAGVTLFAAPKDVKPVASSATVLQGMRERSNASPVLELVNLIDVMRRQEAAQRSMNMLNDAVEQHISTEGGI
jgi:flagellar basal body rod protein FlgG